MPLTNDETPITNGLDVTNSEGILLYGADSGSLARQIATNKNGNLVVDMTLDAKTQFGQFRTANPFTLADYINKYGVDLIEYSSSSVGSGTVVSVTSQSAARLSVTAGATDYARLRTNTYFRYQAGKQQTIRLSTYIPGGGKTNQISRFGYFDDSNGLFFALSGSSFGTYRRTIAGGTLQEFFVSQSSFNYDKLDGQGPSGKTFDVTKANLFEIRFQWLGVGNVEYFINNSLVHTLNNPGLIAGPYMQTATLPVALEIQNVGASTINELNFICASVEAEGGTVPPKYTFNAFNSADVATTTTERPILAIRPGLLFRGLENRVVGLPIRLAISTEGTRAGFRIILNPTTLTGGVWVSGSVNNSAFEYNATATAFTGGETIYRGFIPNTNDVKEVDLKVFFDFNSRLLKLNAFGTAVDTLLITGVNEATGTTQMRSSLTWQEIR